MCSHFEIIFSFWTIRIFEAAGGCTLTRHLACGMITISDLWCNCEKQEYQGLSFFNKVICDTSTISVNIRVLLKEISSELLLNILTYHLAESIP